MTDGSTWRLHDAEARNRAAPDSFFIPPHAKRESLKVGDRVKLLFEGPTGRGDDVVERMWVDVTSVDAQSYRGSLLNQPTEITTLHPGDEVAFEPKHVAAYDYSPEELGYDPSAFALVSGHVSRDRKFPALAFTRDEDQWFEWRSDERDSAWTIGSGEEDEGYVADFANFDFWSLGWLTDKYPALEAVLGSGESGVWRWDENSREYRKA